jgi:bleomycin hydrolase
MKNFILAAVLLVGSSIANAQDNLVSSLKNNASDSSKLKFKFTDVVNLANSPVKNQGSSGTCWSYSGNSFLESEMLRIGKPFVDVSEIYTARCAYLAWCCWVW